MRVAAVVGQDGRGGAANVRVGVLQVLEIDGGIAVQRMAVEAGSVGAQREHSVAPVMLGAAVGAVAGGHVDLVRGRVVDDAWPRPDGRLNARTVGAGGGEMHSLVTAHCVEHVL